MPAPSLNENHIDFTTEFNRNIVFTQTWNWSWDDVLPFGKLGSISLWDLPRLLNERLRSWSSSGPTGVVLNLQKVYFSVEDLFDHVRDRKRDDSPKGISQFIDSHRVFRAGGASLSQARFARNKRASIYLKDRNDLRVCRRKPICPSSS
jgi:hypothetical protein